jgi:hypothetical protein
MSNEHDPLRALFAEAHETLPSAEFIQTFLTRVERARRMQSMRRIALGIAVGVLAAWILPSVLASTAAVMHAAGEQARPYGDLLISPAGWAVSMLIGFLVLRRTGALRRR